MTSYTEKIVRMRRREDDDDIIVEDLEEGEYSTEAEGSEEEESEGGRRSHHRRKSSKRHHHKKHHKKEKKKKKRRKRSTSRQRSRSSSPPVKRNRKSSADDTDHEGDRASTPEIIDVDAIEDGEISSPRADDSPVEVLTLPTQTTRKRSRTPPSTKSSSRSSRRRRSPSMTKEEPKGRSKNDSKSANGDSRHEKRRRSPEKTRSKSPSKEESFKESLSVDETNKLREKLGLKPLKVDQPKNENPIKEKSAPSKSHKEESLSIEETNRLRAEIGLKPLKVNDTEDTTKTDILSEGPSEFSEFEIIPSSLKNERHRPPENLGEVSRTEKIRKKLQERREKRRQESKLLVTKGLGEADGTEDTSAWVKKQERIHKDKEAAAKRAKMLDELDDDFGVGNLVNEDVVKSKGHDYSQRDLKGLKVEHSVDNFSEGRSVILTLKDSDILDETEGDTLVNVNMVDDEKAKKKIEDAKKAKTGYNPYDQEMVDDETGEVRRKNLLDKYDEEIDGEAKKSFAIGSEGVLSKDKEKEKIRDRLNKNLVSLELPEKKIASDYYTPGEVIAFKKTKKKKKVKRRMLKADDLINMMNDEPTESFGSRNQSSAPKEIEDLDTGEIKDLSKVDVCQEDKEEELSQAEKLRLKIKEKLKKKKPKTDIGDLLLEEAPSRGDEVYSSSGAELIGTFADDEINSKNIILNETSEFCRNLGAWTSNYSSYETKESSGSNVLDEFEDSLKSNSTKSREDRWKEMDMSCGEDDDDTDREDNLEKPVESVTILDEEPNLNVGVGSAIKMAVNKGYWESDVKKKSASNLKHLMSQNYFIEDKVRDDDRSSRRQDRYGGGPTVAFQEKKDYTPNVKLEYIDDSGRKLNSKEAFRYLSHRFHGKGSGKLKTEKRMKKSAEESMMRNMSSTDTPLGTVEKMLKKQKETSTPYLVISGKNQHPELRK